MARDQFHARRARCCNSRDSAAAGLRDRTHAISANAAAPPAEDPAAPRVAGGAWARSCRGAVDEHVDDAPRRPGTRCWRAFSRQDARWSQCVLALPGWAEGAADIGLFQRTLQHITDCADLCEYVGESLLVAGRHPSAKPQDDEPGAVPYPFLLLRSFRQAEYGEFEEDYGESDPFAQLSDDAMDRAPSGYASDECVLGQTRAWVEGIIVDMKVCPFLGGQGRAANRRRELPDHARDDGRGGVRQFWGRSSSSCSTSANSPPSSSDAARRPLLSGRACSRTRSTRR